VCADEHDGDHEVRGGHLRQPARLPPHPDGADPAAGETVFKKCAACHKLDGSNGVGPHLDGVVARPIAGVEGFAYSDPMASHGGDWTPENLFQFLDNPKGFIPGTKMTFAGLPKEEDRANVIAYLEQHGG
jgi:cytochrome c